MPGLFCQFQKPVNSPVSGIQRAMPLPPIQPVPAASM